jgi:hypothetical protein
MYAKDSDINWIEQPKKKKKYKAKFKRVIHPIFEFLSEDCTDVYWSKIFKNASVGKFPNDIVYRNDYISYTKKNIKMKVPEDPYDLAEDFIDFLGKYKNMHGENECDDERGEIKWTVWKDVKKKQKLILREVYILGLSKKHTMDKNLTDAVRKLISYGFLTKEIDSKYVMMGKGKILYINNVVIENGIARIIK